MSTPYKTFSSYTFGCKVNFADTSIISRDLLKKGYSQVDFNQNPDIYIINTCSVTENADKKAIKLIKSINKNSPRSKILVTGCYAQLKPEEVSAIPGVKYVIGSNNKFNISQILDNVEESNIVEKEKINKVTKFDISYSLNERTRAFIKIQDGCDYSCTYCTIPLARGQSRSFDVLDTLNTIKDVVNHGFQEIVLSGINIGDFGNNNNENLEMLLYEIETIKNLKRYRISSIEPNLISDNLIKIISNSKKALPHFHVPLQSGSDKILKKMKRRYTALDYKKVIKKITNLIPNVGIGVDVIVGFPGETEKDFKLTYNLIKELDISYLHVFTYSKRSNTIASEMLDQVDDTLKINRRKELVKLSNKKNNDFIKNNINQSLEILFENKEGEFWSGLSTNYIKVMAASNQSLKNKIKKVKLRHSYDNYVIGDIIG